MKNLLGVVGLLCVGCGGTANQPPPTGTWTYSGASSSAVASYNPDGTYEFQRVAWTSPTTANDQAETGTFTASDGSIQTAPSGACGATASSFGYDVTGDELTLMLPGGPMTLKRGNLSSMVGVTVTFGCFDSAGSFSPGS